MTGVKIISFVNQIKIFKLHLIEFWSSVICDFDRVNLTEHSKFRTLISIGIPSQLRGKLWRIFSNSETDSDLVENEYRELLDRTSPHEKLIRRDLSRTFPTLPYFKDNDGEGQEMLFNVIKAYSLFDEHVGYCQGLHFVVGVLLLHVGVNFKAEIVFLINF